MKRITLDPDLRDLRMLLRSEDLLYDPSSFWLVRTAVARRVGAWTHSSRLWRTPLRDWLLRAWRSGARFAFTPDLAGIRVVTHNHRASRRRYNARTPEHQRLIQLFESLSPERLRQRLPLKLRQKAALLGQPLRRRERPARLSLPLRLQALLYRLLGLDWPVLRWRFQGVPAGAFHSRLLRLRTGETLAVVPDLAPLLAEPERYRVL